VQDYSLTADNYAYDVISGQIPAAKYIKLAAQRHLDDKKKQSDEGHSFYYDEAKAHKACKFIEAQYHTKGKWARTKQHLILEPWQIFFICNVFGWMKASNNFRRYREVLLLVPRKNGKSALAAAIGLYMLSADGEFGAEVYTGATSEKQAKEVFVPAQTMARMNPAMTGYFGIQVNASNICIPENGSKMEPIIGNPPDGSSPSCAIIDEVHEHKDSRLIDTMITGMGAREQPMALYITTAGDNLSGPCYQLQLEAQKCLEGIMVNDELFPLIYGIDQGDDWSDLNTLIKANPNYGVSVSEDFLFSRLQDAKNNARKQSTFLTKHLNVWVGSREAFFNVDKWRQCTSDIKISDYFGQPIYIGMDLASRVDIAAIEVLIPVDDDYVRFGKYYLPESAVDSGNEMYTAWMREGWMTITDGEIIDFNIIKEDILELCSQFEVRELAYDPFQATMLITELMAEGVPVVEMRPTVLNFSEPMKSLDALIRAKQIKHNGDPVQEWMISNVVAKEDAKENVYPRKERAENKIDGVIALLMALGRCQHDQDSPIDFDNLLTVTL
jgi:phage terminase large subunit-like protein